MASKVISIRYEEDELAALQHLADAAGVDFGEFVRSRTRFGIAADPRQLAEQRRMHDLAISEQQLRLVAQSVKLLQGLADHVGLDVDAAIIDANAYGLEAFAECVKLERQVADEATVVAGAVPNVFLDRHDDAIDKLADAEQSAAAAADQA